MGEENKICFVIAPIGQPDSDIRERSDQIFEYVIQPAAKACGYEAIRADHISEPGIITRQVIEHIIKDPIVVADITGHNPNVFYELAVRHMLRKPYIQIIERGESIPFDVAVIRTIEVDHHNLKSAEKAKSEITRQIQSMTEPNHKVDSPISIVLDFEELRQSSNPEQRQLTDIFSTVAELRSTISMVDRKLDDFRPVIIEMEDVLRRPRLNPGMIEEILFIFDRLVTSLEPTEGKEVSKPRIEEARESLRRLERMLHMIVVESGIPSKIEEEYLERRVRRKKPE